MGYVADKIRTLPITGYDVVRVALGLLLLTAAGLKGHQLATEPVLGNGILESRWFLIGVVEFELLLGLWLLAGIWPKRTWKVAVGCFSLFAGVSLEKALSGDARCGCFGNVSVSPWYTFALDTCAVMALFRWRPAARQISRAFEVSSELEGIYWTAIIWLGVSVPTASALARFRETQLDVAGFIIGSGNSVVLNPVEWLDKRFPLSGHIDVGDELAEGRWVVLLYRPGCSACERAIATYETPVDEWGHSRVEERIALVSVDSASEGSHMEIPSLIALRGRADPSHVWIINTPLEVALDDGVVKGLRREGVAVSSTSRDGW